MKEANYRQALIDKIEVPVEQKEVTAGAVKTAYLSAGAGLPVVCLHGAGAGAVTWYPSIAALAGHFHVIAPDIVDYGESDKPNAAYDRPYFAAWLRDFLSALEISKAHIVGPLPCNLPWRIRKWSRDSFWLIPAHWALNHLSFHFSGWFG